MVQQDCTTVNVRSGEEEGGGFLRDNALLLGAGAVGLGLLLATDDEEEEKRA